MKTLIVYNSIHKKNTEKVARAMAEELGAEIVSIADLKDYDVSGYDLIGLGSGIYFGKHHASIINLVDKLANIKNKRFFIFSTSGSGESIFNNFNKPLKEKLLSKGARIVGSFSCRGFDDIIPFKYFGGLNKARPNDKDLEQARSFARSLKPKQLTLAVLAEGGKVLLGMKKRGWGEGRWNGFGGKLEGDEDIVDAAKREFFEESKIVANSIKEIGVVEFDYIDSNKYLEVHIFKVCEYFGEPEETEEMKPQWFYLDEIPFEKMWPDDAYWFPLFLQEKKFRGKFLFEDNSHIIERSLDSI
jgi:8-oxo-dGTP diphosphatase/2-hydroxy-dATP diphosphatase